MRYKPSEMIRLYVVFFNIRVEYSKSNINDRYRVAIWDSCVRDFAIVGKILVRFGINVMGADWGGTYTVNPDDW